ncbi:hypothetical protein [Parvibaculum sp.]|uniref:hypothetical protein n=1 Tax=Parvibaculum sp. TaxID=2024848 RepID=UPI0027374C93|nr:hypothetical protein [Parvibaculum sp.]MDP3327716.1 hypothetical protein [Parvibaculum sp.]
MTDKAETVANRLERGIFLGVRIVVGAVAALALAALLVSGFALVGQAGSAGVTYGEVQAAIESGAAPADDKASPRADAGIALPPRVDHWLNDDDNMDVLNGWLSEYPKIEERREFLENLEYIIVEAEKRGDDVIESINAFSTVKLTQKDAAPFATYESAARSAAAIAGIVASLAILIAAALLLVVLAIERNTRPSHPDH